jgi:hypothetical protein
LKKPVEKRRIRQKSINLQNLDLSVIFSEVG